MKLRHLLALPWIAVSFATAAISATACAGSRAASPSTTRPAPAEQECAPIQWIDDSGHETQQASSALAIVVPIELEGQTYRFQLDTGADTVLYGTDLAHARGWKIESGGHPFVRLSGSVAGRHFSNADITILPDAPGGDIAGTLGMDLLLDRVTSIDFPAKRVCIYDQMPEEIERRATFAPALLDHGRLLVRGTLAGRDYERILFDTGSSHFALVGSFESWKRWTGLDGEAGVTQRISGNSWGHEIHMLGAPATGALTVASLSVEHPVAFYCKEKPDFFADSPMPQDAIMGSAPFLSAAIVLDARRAKPRFGVVSAPSSPRDAGLVATASTSADSSASSDPCDALVAAVAAEGPVGLRKQADPPLDPVCAWRVDDAEAAVLLAADDAQLGPSGASAAADLRKRLGKPAGVQRLQGRVDPSVLERTFLLVQAAIAACVKDVPDAKPVLRVRVAFDAAGAVTSALTDYAITLPTPARDCVVNRLRGLRLPHPAGDETVVFGVPTTH